jgi:imidazolonepropionase-like amidohydrolase
MTQKLFKNCRILDVINQTVLDSYSIWVEGPTIQRVAPDGDFKEESYTISEQHTYDLKGQLVLPGLIDTHVHLNIVRTPSIQETVLENLRAPETLKVLYGAKHANETLAAGFTTVRDMGQGDNIALRDAINAGVIPGPRIVACRWLGMTSGHGEQMSTEWIYHVRLRDVDQGVDGPWQIRKKVRQLIGQGADFIKTYATSGGFLPNPFHPFFTERPNYTLEELQAIVAEAHAGGRRVAAQAFIDTIGTKNAIRAGIDTIEHGLVLDDDDTRAMQAKGLYYVPTLAMTDKVWNVDETEKGQFFQIQKEDAKRYLELQIASFNRAREHGVKIAFGSDCFRVMKHGENAGELELRVLSGMSEMEALVSATIVSAEALGIQAMVGSIEEGKWADLLVVDPDPLQDITTLQNKKNIKMVVKNGDIMRFTVE